MEILKNFGFEPTFFVAQIINFLILAFIFKRYLYKPVLKMLHDREKKIAQGLKDAENSALTLEQAEARKDEIIKAATQEAEKIIDETKKNAEQLGKDLIAQTKSDAEKIISEAKTEAANEFENMKNDAQNLSLELARDIIDKVIGEMFTKEEKEKIIQRNIKKLEKYE